MNKKHRKAVYGLVKLKNILSYPDEMKLVTYQEREEFVEALDDVLEHMASRKRLRRDK